MLLIRGEILDNTDRLVKKLLETHATDTICFSSEGGDTEASIRIGKLIDKKGFDTCLAERYKLNNEISLRGKDCLSACPYMFLTGKKRISLGDDFKIGVHSSGWAIGCCFLKLKITDNKSAMEGFKNMFLATESKYDNKHIELIDFASKTSYSGMECLNQSQLEYYSFFTQKFK